MYIYACRILSIIEKLRIELDFLPPDETPFSECHRSLGGGKSNSIGKYSIVGINYNFNRKRKVLPGDRNLANLVVCIVVFFVLTKFRRFCRFRRRYLSFLSFWFWGDGGSFQTFSSGFPAGASSWLPHFMPHACIVSCLVSSTNFDHDYFLTDHYI